MKKGKNVNQGGKKITKWAEYNKALEQRGTFQCFMSEDLLEKGWYVNEKKVGKGNQL